MEKFKELGLSTETIDTLAKKGFEEPTEIQALSIPLLLKNEIDIIAQAQTGTGKTAAFGLPLIEEIDGDSGVVEAIILAPTRELVIQVCEEINSLKGNRRISIAPIYGGQSIELQLRKLKRGISIVVGTPGRIMDHLRRKTLKLDNLKYFILDEADEMLNMGFVDDIETILESTPDQKRVMLFSATMPVRIKKLAEKYMGKYEHLKTKTKLTVNLTDQIYFEVPHRDKFEALCRIIDIESEFYGMVFCRTKIDVDTVVSTLLDRGYLADGLHGDISQAQREKILNKFRKKRVSILVATDVAARGIDVDNLTHVINYSIPQNPEAYVHRIGRTGRAGKEGTAITFITSAEFRKLGFIKKVAKTEIRKERLPEVSDIIKVKKDRINESLATIIAADDTKGYQKWATEMIGDNEPEKVLAALLKDFYGKDLDEKSYRKIGPSSSRFGERSGRSDRGDRGGRGRDRDRGGRDSDHGSRGDRGDRGRERFDRGNRGRSTVEEGGTTRLFIARGKSAGITKQGLVQLITDQAGTHQRFIDDVEVRDNFSFVTVPFVEAEVILSKFKKAAKGQRSIVEKAAATRESGQRRDHNGRKKKQKYRD